MIMRFEKEKESHFWREKKTHHNSNKLDECIELFINNFLVGLIMNSTLNLAEILMLISVQNKSKKKSTCNAKERN